MKRLFLFLLPLLFTAVALGQTIVKLDLAKDNGKGKPGQVVKEFAPNDNPFHCVLHLKPLTATAIFTATLTAVNAGGVQNYRVAATDLSANAGMDLVDFKFSLPRPWPVGSYKIELKANGKPIRNITFDVK